MKTIAFWAGWIFAFSLIAMSFDLSNQRDRALAELAVLKPRLVMAEQSLTACRNQARQLASRPVTICHPPAPCQTLGERLHRMLEGDR